MTNNNNLRNKTSVRRGVACNALFGALMCLIAASLFTTCEKVPDYCSRGNRYDPDYQFCFAGYAYTLCNGKSYNPLTQDCDLDRNTVGTRCLDATIVKLGTPCAGYTLSVGTAPPDGGRVTRTPEESNFAADDPVVLSAIAEDGYTFVGWAGASTATDANITVTMDSNKPLVAIFNPASTVGAATHTLVTSAFPQNGGSTNLPNATNHGTGTQVSVTATPAQGYTFSGWSGASTLASPTVNITMDDSKTLVAMFTPIMYTLRVNASPESGGTIFVNGTALTGVTPQNSGTQITALAQAAHGYTFTGWSGVAVGIDNPMTIHITESNQTLTANFQRQSSGGDTAVAPTTYTLTVNAGTGGTVSPSGTSTHNTNAQISITATAASGYEFSNWTATGGGSVADANSRTTIVTLTSNATVTANFRYSSGTQPPNTYVLMVNRNPTEGGTVFVENVESLGTTYHEAETQVNIRAEAALGYRFTGWTGVATSTNASLPPLNMPRADIELIANFEHVGTHTLTIRSEPLNAGKMFVNNVESNGITTHTVGALVTVRAEALQGYRFIRWTGASTAITISVTVTMSSARTLTANFEEWAGESSFTDPRDNKVYAMVEIGGMIWMAENLNHLPLLGDNCWCYNNEPSNCEIYGRLYTWDAARTACPAGWRLPTNADWNNLVTFIGTSAGTKLKSEPPRWNGTDDYGFLALPGGSRSSTSTFGSVGADGRWWSATEHDASTVWHRFMLSSNDNLLEGNSNKSFAFSVRCVMN